MVAIPDYAPIYSQLQNLICGGDRLKKSDQARAKIARLLASFRDWLFGR